MYDLQLVTSSLHPTHYLEQRTTPTFTLRVLRVAGDTFPVAAYDRLFLISRFQAYKMTRGEGEHCCPIHSQIHTGLGLSFWNLSQTTSSVQLFGATYQGKANRAFLLQSCIYTSARQAHSWGRRLGSCRSFVLCAYFMHAHLPQVLSRTWPRLRWTS